MVAVGRMRAPQRAAHLRRHSRVHSASRVASAGQPNTFARLPALPPAIERQPAIPGEYLEEGVASWYGIPFNGHRTSNGEIYDMHEFTAAHRTLPFNCVVRVTNLDNGKQTEVRINDRGPFVANRVIDLSLSAAQAIEMVGPRHRERASGNRVRTKSAGRFLRQCRLARSKCEENAERLKAQMEASYSPVSIATYDSPNGTFYRVRVGRLPTRRRSAPTRQPVAQCGAVRPPSSCASIIEIRVRLRHSLLVLHHVHAIPIRSGRFGQIFLAARQKNSRRTIIRPALEHGFKVGVALPRQSCRLYASRAVPNNSTVLSRLLRRPPRGLRIS